MMNTFVGFYLKRAAAIFLIVVLSACQQNQVEVVALASSSHCASEEAFRQLASEAEIHQAMKKSVMTMSSNSAKKTTSPEISVEFEKQYVVLVAAGQKPTAGYQFVLNNKVAKIDKGSQAAHLPLVLQEPETGAIHAQMVTQPCIVVALSKGEMQSVVFKDKKVDLK